jgi:hypothetical protein
MSVAALCSDSTAVLISEVANAALLAVAASSLAFNHQNVNIKSLVPITLDMLSTSFQRWCNTFRIIFGRFDMLLHVEANNPRPDDAT